MTNDVSLSEWDGIGTNDYGNFVGVDLKKIDPTREHVDHSLSNLLTLDQCCSATDHPTAKCINEIIRIYCYHPSPGVDSVGPEMINKLVLLEGMKDPSLSDSEARIRQVLKNGDVLLVRSGQKCTAKPEDITVCFFVG